MSWPGGKFLPPGGGTREVSYPGEPSEGFTILC